MPQQALASRPRRRLLQAGLLPLAAGLAGRPAPAAEAGWPQWQRFAQQFVQADGRVVDHSTAEKHSTSEGQSYGMFFALVAQDRAAFERLWAWSLANLAPQGLDKQLPAWRWGRKPDGSWGVLDQNSASDADLWFAYSLLEAERLWQAPAYGRQARQLLERIAREEVTRLPGLGAMLLPGPQGFHPQPDVWRLNPSYCVWPQLRRLALLQPDGPWADIARNSVRLIEAASPRGFVPDWVGYQAGDGLIADPQAPELGSYDAIRCYLWAGIAAPGDAAAERVLKAIGGLRNHFKLTGELPEKVATASGQPAGQAPAGFYAACVPYLTALGEPVLRQRCLAALDAATGAQRDRADNPWLYYDHVLALFALGHAQNRYGFTPEGQLRLGAA